MSELEPIEPSKALELYLEQKGDDAADSTVKSHRYRLQHFIQWCDEEGIDNLNELTGRRCYEFRLWRKEDGDLNTVSIRTQLTTLRAFLKFCATINAVEDGIHDTVVLPKLNGKEGVRDEILEADRAEEIINYLRRFEYASRKHVVMILLWHTSMRIGAIHSLDVGDFDPEECSIALRHRPEADTRLKNGVDGERLVAITQDIREVLNDWIQHNRPNSEDEYGREPLLATEQGRIHKNNIRNIVYGVTRPCFVGNACCCEQDHGYSNAYRCNESVSPHSIRRGSITHHLKQEVPSSVISDRANVSQDVLHKHYDRMTEQEKMEQRRDYFKRL